MLRLQTLDRLCGLSRCISIFFVKQEGQKFIHDEEVLLNLENTLDRWILSFTQSLVLFVHQEMAGECIIVRLLMYCESLLHF